MAASTFPPVVNTSSVYVLTQISHRPWPSYCVTHGGVRLMLWKHVKTDNWPAVRKRARLYSMYFSFFSVHHYKTWPCHTLHTTHTNKSSGITVWICCTPLPTIDTFRLSIQNWTNMKSYFPQTSKEEKKRRQSSNCQPLISQVLSCFQAICTVSK